MSVVCNNPSKNAKSIMSENDKVGQVVAINQKTANIFLPVALNFAFEETKWVCQARKRLTNYKFAVIL